MSFKQAANNSSGGNRNRTVDVVGTLEAIHEGKGKVRTPSGSALVIELDDERGKANGRPKIDDFETGTKVWAEGGVDTGKTITGKDSQEPMSIFDVRWLSKLHDDAAIFPNHALGAFQDRGDYTSFMLDTRAAASYEQATTSSVTEALGLAYDRAIADREAGVQPPPDGVLMAFADSEFDGQTWVSLFTRADSDGDDQAFVLKSREQFIESGFKAQVDNPHAPLNGRPTVADGVDADEDAAQFAICVGNKNNVGRSQYASEPKSAGMSMVGKTFVQVPKPGEDGRQRYRIADKEMKNAGMMRNNNGADQTPMPSAKRMAGITKFMGQGLKGEQAPANDAKDDDENEAFADARAGMAAG